MNRMLSLSGPLLLLGALFLAGGAVSDDPRGTYAGPAVTLGQGSMHAFVTLGADGKPTEIGVSLTRSALQGLPPHIDEADTDKEEFILLFPEQARAVPVQHVGVNWRPHGHEPDHIYTVPHFDFHFYLISRDEREAIVPEDPAFLAKGTQVPDAALVPAGYISPPDNPVFPFMGTHFIDPASLEFNGAAFTHTMIYGFYEGRMTFYEPMITVAFLESLIAEDAPTREVVAPMAQPQIYPKPGYYPTEYRIRYDAETETLSVVAAGMVLRPAIAKS